MRIKTLIGLFSCMAFLIACGDSAGNLRGGDGDKLEDLGSGSGVGTGTGTGVDDTDGDTDAGTDTGTGSGGTPLKTYAWDDQHPSANLWADFANSALQQEGATLLAGAAQDIAEYCSNYSSLSDENKQIFWTAFIAGMSKYESGFDPDSFEVISTAGGNVVKRGLLRLDIALADNNGCGVVDAGALHNVQTNFNCAVKVLNAKILTDGYISQEESAGVWVGGASVWPVLQNPTALADIKSLIQATNACN